MAQKVPDRQPVDSNASLPVHAPTDLDKQAAGAVEKYTRVWVEKTIVRGRRDRQEGPYALGQALWSPQRAKNNRDIYRFMRAVQPGDVILHLTDNEGFTGVSRAAGAATEFNGVKGTEWGEGPSYLVRLKEFTKIDPPLGRDVLFSPPTRDELIRLAKEGIKNLFYSAEPSLNQGAYLTPAPVRLVDILNEAYERIANRLLTDSFGSLKFSNFDETGHRATVAVSPPTERTWIFQANPKYFDIRGAVRALSSQTWLVKNYGDQMTVGDKVYLWESGTRGGVLAIGEIIETPRVIEKPAAETPFVRDASKLAGAQRRVNIRILRLVEPILTKEKIRAQEALRNLSILRGPQGTNFRVTPEEDQALQALLGADPLPGPFPNYVEPSFPDIARAILDQGLSISERTLKRYHHALKTRGFVILCGVSGTGKSWLTEAYAKAVGAEYLLVPVAPNWTTNEDLLGYYNPVTREYQNTLFSNLLRRCSGEYAAATARGLAPRPYHVVLDEMNLARVEYYFARLLSAMEVRARGVGATVELGPSEQVELPPSLSVIGTVNIDETTHGFSEKVYDRSQLIELDASREALEARIENAPYRRELIEIWDVVHEVAPFAFRTIDEINAYVQSAMRSGTAWEQAFDEELLQKILPKVKGVDLRLGDALQRFDEITGERFPLSNAKARAMLEAFRRHGTASYF